MISGLLLSLFTSQIVSLLAGALGFLLLGALALTMIPAGYAVTARVVALAGIMWFAYSLGYRNADNRAEMATLRTQLRIAQADANIQKIVRSKAQALLAARSKENEGLAAQVAKYEEDLSNRPVTPGRGATDFDVKRLRAIGR